MLTIYKRFKKPKRVNGRSGPLKRVGGIRHSTITGLFSVRPYSNTLKRQVPHALASKTFAEARQEADEFEKLWEAQSKGLTVGEMDVMQNSHRLPIKLVVDTYLDLKKNKRPKTVAQYRTALREFQESTTAKYLDEINTGVLRNHMNCLTEKGYAGKTMDTRLHILYFLLKRTGVTARIPKDEMPTVETEAAVPFSDAELKAMFKIMSPEDNIVYSFFLGTAARQQEVEFAAWADINFERGIYNVHSKPEVGFVIKSHQSREIVMPDSLTKALKARREKMPDGRWIFPSRDGGTRNNFLLKLKKIALRAGINCGQCRTIVTKGEYDKKKKVEVTCATDPVCAHVLHS